MAEQEANAGGMKKELTLFNFFTIGFGAIIGTGWVLLVGDWMVLGGGPVPAMIAFGIGAILLVPIGMVFGELTAAIPISGGIIEYVERTFGRKLGFITGGRPSQSRSCSPPASLSSRFSLGSVASSSTPSSVLTSTSGRPSSPSASPFSSSSLTSRVLAPPLSSRASLPRRSSLA